MTVLSSIATLGLIFAGIMTAVFLLGRASGWARASKLLGPPPMASVNWARSAMCLLGTLSQFRTTYLNEVVVNGYEDCSFEVDARNHELPNAGLTWRPI